jgi:hypothetical protein
MVCFQSLKEVSFSPFTVNSTTGSRFQFVNQAGGTVIAYYFPLLQSSIAPDKALSYTISFTGNSTFTGVYIEGTISGNDTINGFAGILGTSHYEFVLVGASNMKTITYLVDESSSRPYVIGVGNSYGANQNLTLSNVEFASCGETWISQVSAL